MWQRLKIKYSSIISRNAAHRITRTPRKDVPNDTAGEEICTQLWNSDFSSEYLLCEYDGTETRVPSFSIDYIRTSAGCRLADSWEVRSD